MASQEYKAIFVKTKTKKQFTINAVTNDQTFDQYLNHLMEK